MNPKVLAKNAGFEIPAETSIILAECKDIGVAECLTREKLSPVLAIVKSNSTEDGIKKAENSVRFNGLGHSAAIIQPTKKLPNILAMWFLQSA